MRDVLLGVRDTFLVLLGIVVLAAVLGFVPSRQESVVQQNIYEEGYEEDAGTPAPAAEEVAEPAKPRPSDNSNPRHRVPSWARECMAGLRGSERYLPTICARGNRLTRIEPELLFRESAIGSSWEQEARRGWEGPAEPDEADVPAVVRSHQRRPVRRARVGEPGT